MASFETEAAESKDNGGGQTSTIKPKKKKKAKYSSLSFLDGVKKVKIKQEEQIKLCLYENDAIYNISAGKKKIMQLKESSSCCIRQW